LINDVDDDDQDELLNNPGEAVDIDLTDYFRGGTAPFDYGAPIRQGEAPNQGAVTAERVDDGPMYKFSVPDDQQDGAGLNTWKVKITDDDDSTLDITINARRNNAPTALTSPSSATALVGTQAPAKAPSMAAACGNDANNECQVTVTFTDGDVQEMLTVEADDGDAAKAAVVSVTPGAVDSDGSVLSAVVVLRGVASTWADDAMPDDEANDDPGHIPAEIKLTATDRGGETFDATLSVTVDGAPTLAEGKVIPGGTLTAAAPRYVIEDLSGFFANPENAGNSPETLTFTAKSSDTTAAKVAFGTGDNPTDTTGTRLVVSRVAPGSTTITVTATEANSSADPEQSGEGTFTVTVSN
jgi:hypothetical protein